MKMLCKLLIGCLLLFSIVCCSHDYHDSSQVKDSAAYIELHFSTSFVGGRASVGNDDLLSEEGNVVELLYGVFKGNVRVHYECFAQTLHTGDIYRIHNLSSDWFKDGDATVFVVANPTDNIKKYLMNKTGINDWKDCKFELDLNKEIVSDENPTRLFEKPLMAGYVKQAGISGAAIVVPVEHIYSRIWYSFAWLGAQRSDKIVIDSIRISKLMNRTKVFNTSDEEIDYNPGVSSTMWGTAVIENGSREKPFIGNLVPDVGELYHPESGLNMEIFYATRYEYNVVCRYPWEGGVVNPAVRPIRYYTYCYQWNGTSEDDDPMLEVFYHFVLAEGQTVRKRTSARLYDPNYSPGKRHHGMMRNYTYHVICKINTTTNKLDLQVVARPWIEAIVDDIPPFE